MNAHEHTDAAPVPFAPDPLYSAIAAWEAAKSTLADAKTAESNARTCLLDLAFPDDTAPRDGTLYVTLQNGWKLKGEFKHNVKVDVTKVPDMLLRLSLVSDAGMHASSVVLRYKPELSATAYKQLMPSLQAIVDTALITSPASPAFTLVAPKASDAAQPADNN